MEKLVLSDRFADALSFAADLHRGQTRKGVPTPYISHLLSVCALALEYGADEDTAIAALLHDAVEDQGGASTADIIALRFGREVLALVLACTDAIPPSGLPKAPWRERKSAFISRLAHVPDEAALIIVCDKVHNLRCLIADLDREGIETLDRFAEPADLPWYYRSIAKVMQARSAAGPVAELVERATDFGTRVRDAGTSR